MRVALVHDYLREYGGAERVLETLHEMYPDSPVYTSYYFADALPDSFKNWDIRTSVMQKWWGIRSHFLWYTYAVPWVFEQFDLREYDLIISSSSFAAKGVLTNPEQVHIDYCHTPTRFIWGINRNSHRKFVHSLLSPVDTFLRQWDFAAAQRVDYFVANSRVVQERIKRYYKRDAEVIYPPTVTNTVELPVTSAGSYFLVVSRLERLKNVELIIRAFNALNLPLKVAGTGSQLHYLKTIAHKNIEFLGYVDDTTRAELYRECRALVVATENEDFGMTLAEVQGYGRPVIALRSGGYRETVIEDTTGVFFDSPASASIEAAVKRFQGMSFDSKEIIKNSVRFSTATFKRVFNEFAEMVWKSHGK